MLGRPAFGIVHRLSGKQRVAPPGKVVVPTPEALDLVKYLQALKRDYPILPPEPRAADGAQPAPAPGSSAS